MNKRLGLLAVFLVIFACRTSGDWKKDDTLFVRKESRPAPARTPMPPERARAQPQPTAARPPAATPPRPQPTPLVNRPMPAPMVSAPEPGPSASRSELQSRAQMLEQRLALNPNAAASDRRALGDAYAALGRYSLAYDQYRSAQATSPTLQGCLSLVKTQAQTNDGPGAYRVFQDTCRKIPTANPDDKSRAQLIEAFVMWRAGAAYEDGAVKILKARIFESPQDPQAFALLGQIAYSKGQFALAKTYFSRALEQVPGRKPNDLLNNLALAHQGLGEADEAKALWRQTLQNDASFVPALMQMGQAALRAQDAQNAQRLYRQLAQIEPSNADHFVNLGVALRLGNQIDQAEIEYLRALKLKPNDPAALLNLGMLYHKSKRDPLRALYFYQKIATIDPRGYQSKRVKELVEQAQRDANRSAGSGGKK